jgi:AcrR family transcriptional regulator
VSDLKDRRARKKAQTRELVRGTARRMFAERGYENVTIADIAAAADVAVQTVFNHFATKEELFFDGRTPWVTGMAAAVRDRDPSVPPLTALRTAILDAIHHLVVSHTAPERRCYIVTLEASQGLRIQERELVHAAEANLTEALLEAWADDPDAPADPAMAAPLMASVCVAAARTLVIGQRPALSGGADPEQVAAHVRNLAEATFVGLEAAVLQSVTAPAAVADTGWPRAEMRRAG